MLVILKDQVAANNSNDIVRALCARAGLSTTDEGMQKRVQSMLDDGSNYRCLEQELGGGACFVLGTFLSETQ